MEQVLNYILLRKKWRITLSVSAFLAALAIAFVGIELYSILQDEAYMGICCKNYENSPLAMMIFYVGNAWMMIFGDTCLSLRVLCRICILVAIGIGSFYLWQQTHNILLTSVVALFASITANLGDITFYNWDTGAYPIAALGTLFLLRYIDQPSLRNLIMLGVSGGVMIASRIPFIAFSIIILIAIIGVNKNKGIYYQTLLAAITVILSWLLCGFLMVGSLGTYIDSFRSENIINGHSADFIASYIDIFLMLVPRMVFFMIPVTIGSLLGVLLGFKDKLPNAALFVGEVVLVVVVFALSVQYLTNIASFVNEVGLPMLLLAIFWLSIAKSIGYQNSWLVQNRQKLKLGLLLMVMLLLGFGSDMFFNKWTIIFLLPMSLGVIWPALNDRSKRAFKLTFLLLIPVLLMWVPIKEKCIESGCVELCGFRRVNNLKMSEYKAHPIYELNEYLDRNKLESDSIAFIGSPIRYIYAYEFGECPEATSILHYYHWEDNHQDSLNKIIGKVPVLIVVGKYPNSVRYLVEKGYIIDSEDTEYTVLRLK